MTTPPSQGAAVVHGVLAAAGTSADPASGRGEAERLGLPQLPEATQEDSATRTMGHHGPVCDQGSGGGEPQHKDTAGVWQDGEG